MKIIADHSKFIDAVKSNENIFLKPNGEWKILNGVNRFFSKISSSFRNSQTEKVANSFISLLDNLEKIPVRVNTPGKKALPQQVDFTKYISAAKAVSRSMKGNHSKKIQQARANLKRRIVALQYRLENENGGLDPVKASNIDKKTIDKLTNEIKNWKDKTIPQNPEISEREKGIIEKTCRHKKFVKLLMSNPRLLTDFAKWTIRDENSVETFIQYVNVQNVVSKCAISARLGRSGKETLRIEVNANNEKIVTLPFVLGEDHHIERVNILDSNRKVVFYKDYSLSIKEVFKVFADRKKNIIGNLEVFEKGITNWNPQHWTRFNGSTHEKLDIQQERWWEKLPTYKSYSIEEAKKEFGQDLDGKNWKVFACATRQGKKLDFEGNHGYMMVVIPTSDGKYRAYPFGKFAKEFPETILGKLTFLTKTVPASIFYLDENVYMSHRENWGYPITITPKDGKLLMDSIRDDKIESEKKNGNFYFQVEDKNCANWVQTTLEKVLGKKENGGLVPNFYRIPMLEAEPQNFIFKPIYKFLHKRSPKMQKFYMKIINLFLGCWQSYKVIDSKGRKRKISIMNSSFWNKQEIYHPAALAQRLEQNKLKSTHPIRKK